MVATPLAGRRVLVPRGGELGEWLAAQLRMLGAKPTVAPLIAFAPPSDSAPLARAREGLAQACYDWLVVTSATTVDVLGDSLVHIPDSTRVAAVGDATATALRAHGCRVDFVPREEQSATGLLREWPGDGGRVLLPQSEIAADTLERGLGALGCEVVAVAAYTTRGVLMDEEVRRRVSEGAIDAVLLTSGSMARELAAQCAPLPESTLVVCLGVPTASAAATAGLSVAAVARRNDREALIEALVELNP
ncbi:uroporphyrinogen-III synthase [Salinibacterium sp. SYSU T00001]|uniref:uroporphyrinogen-III synthase n=1 Tax=Homoserinimonas sedimenticola TaxID=2986805 RepID=UPI00223614F3|nr:uroporphyrinogen-III synthase [Salinibacterium sedimenticola]MCW4384442.1 uroporphyrinogen-III synthase [Salinibacterium sedimenticola]